VQLNNNSIYTNKCYSCGVVVCLYVVELKLTPDCAAAFFDSTVKNVEIYGSNFTNTYGYWGTVVALGSTEMTVSDSIFYNTGSRAIYYKPPTAANLTVTGCTLYTSGAVGLGSGYVQYIAPANSSITFSYNNFTNLANGAIGAVGGLASTIINQTLFNGNGNGAVSFANATSVTIVGSTFTSNTNTNAGGAGNFGSIGSVTVESSSFTAKSAGTFGGAFYFSLVPNIVVDGCSFTSNSATSNSGGAMYMSLATQATITGSSFNLNVANWGGAIAALKAPLNIAQCTFNANSAKNHVLNQNSAAIYAATTTMQLSYSTFSNHVTSPY